jgi:phage portal protein BeeE
MTGIVRLPPDETFPVGGLLPSSFVWFHGQERIEFSTEDVAHFAGYNPLNSLMGLSPLETLRQVLAEETAAAENREAYWRNASRMEGVIEQSKDAKDWTEPQQQAFRTQWQEYSAGGAKAGMTAVLPKGMTLKPWSFNARDSEYVASRKLSREECAAAYHIPLPMVGILDHATFSNIKEQHKQLYADSLGPWIEMITEELEAQILVEARDQQDVYVEFNIAEKLKGSFEEQAASLHALVGRPIMTANEGRARLNLPALADNDADTLAPQQGGPASVALPPADDADALTTARTSIVDDVIDAPPALAAHVERIERASAARHSARLRKLPASQRALALNPQRCVAELTYDLYPHLGAAAPRVAAETVTSWSARLHAGAGEI